MRHIDGISSHPNLARLLLEIRASDGTVRSNLARSLHLSFATVSNLYKVLEENGYIRSDELRQSSGGRRAAEIRFNPRARHSIAIHIEHHLCVRLALLDLSNNVVEETYIEPDHGMSADEVIGEIAAMHRAQLERHRVDQSLIIGAGVAIPGFLNRTSGIVQATTSSVLANLNLRDRLERALSCPVHIQNDADMAALAFSIEHGQDVQNILLIYFTVGIGLGIVIRGSVYNGETGFAGELGHTRWGCKTADDGTIISAELKSLVSVQSLLAEYHNRSFDDEALHQRWLPMMEDLRKQHAKGDERAVGVLTRSGRFLGQVVGALADIFDPGVVAIGGHVDPILPVWLPPIRDQARISSYYTRSRDLMITEVPDLESAILTGCGETAFQQWLRTSDIVKTP